MTELNLNGLRIHRVKDTIFIPLPSELWRKANGCQCDICKKDGTGGYWDTLAVSAKGGKNGEYSYTVHYPELHNEAIRKANRY